MFASRIARSVGDTVGARAIAAQLRRQFGATVEVIGGTLGQFDVYVDGELVVSKGKSLLQRVRSGRLPDATQIMAVIERHLPEQST